ncbi:hypothetical protein A6A08_15715 [Nocardiopsis sp. TSRI0078]|uniref:hypothetical protein n=1 Tax=unclassified Nocardiopsis TaxID=2649073 RepID=UPI0009597E6F|nr:hypothetical protein [Nocardiopsis sp. TSRI0078]OKI13716.1 hypothetical protein A6A08_15715 [Nocardiopsis sp. TSRI0078]
MVRAQNNPRAFTYLTFGFLVLLVWLLFLGLAVAITESHVDTLVYAGTGLLAAVGLTVLTSELGAWETRRVNGGRPLPADADPVRVATAERLVEEGGLGRDPETNRLARILAEQALRQVDVRYPRAWTAFLAVTALFVGTMAARNLVTEGLTPGSTLHSVILVLCLCSAWWHPAEAARKQHRAEAFHEAYDRYTDEGRAR